MSEETTNNNTENRNEPREEGTFEPRQRRVQIPKFVFKRKDASFVKQI